MGPGYLFLYFTLGYPGQLRPLPQLKLYRPADDDGKKKTTEPQDPVQSKTDPL
jgi:hypothetical protein